MLYLNFEEVVVKSFDDEFSPKKLPMKRTKSRFSEDARDGGRKEKKQKPKHDDRKRSYA